MTREIAKVVWHRINAHRLDSVAGITGVLAALVTRAGFEAVTVHTDASAWPPDVDVGCMNHRLAAGARKS